MTTYSPMKRFGVRPGSVVGLVGLGGLGDMAVKIATAMGAAVTVFTSTQDKIEWAGRLGAGAVPESDRAAYEARALSFDLILSTVPESHKVDRFIPLLKRNGTFCAVGALNAIPGYNNQELIMHRRTLAGSLIGSIAETQEVLDLCAEHRIAPEVEMIDIQDINSAFRRVKAGDVRFRTVIDMASLKREMEAA